MPPCLSSGPRPRYVHLGIHIFVFYSFPPNLAPPPPSYALLSEHLLFRSLPFSSFLSSHSLTFSFHRWMCLVAFAPACFSQPGIFMHIILCVLSLSLTPLSSFLLQAILISLLSDGGMQFLFARWPSVLKRKAFPNPCASSRLLV